ncbi:MAG: tetratricopeptide repeat protein, partial [Candidatus Thermoplasmatota archaeon]
MVLFPGLFDREGRLLEKVNRLTQAGTEHEQKGVDRRALVTYERALGLLEAQHQAPKQRPEEGAEAYASVSGGFLRLGQFDAAQVAATRALTLNGSSVKALGAQGDVLVSQGRAEGALPYYEAALRLDPKAKVVWERKGDAHATLGQRQEAIRAYVQAVNLDPDDVEGYARLVALLPEDADMWVRKGDAHRRRQEWDEANASYDRALRVATDRKDALEGKAQLYLASGQTEKAVRVLDRLLQIDPSDPDAWKVRGDVLAATNRGDEAIRA